MAQFVKVGTRADLENRRGKARRGRWAKIAIFNVGGRYYAIENTCPHRGGPLAEGKIEADEVICPRHGSRFNVKTCTSTNNRSFVELDLPMRWQKPSTGTTVRSGSLALHVGTTF